MLKSFSNLKVCLVEEWSINGNFLSRKCNNAANFLHLQLLRTFKDIYHASDRPLHCQYGAVTGIAMLGADVSEILKIQEQK